MIYNLDLYIFDILYKKSILYIYIIFIIYIIYIISNSIYSIFIAGDNSDLSALQQLFTNDAELALLLIKAMISNNPTERPSASTICNYPIFWNSSKILNFFQVRKISQFLIYSRSEQKIQYKYLIFHFEIKKNLKI